MKEQLLTLEQLGAMASPVSVGNIAHQFGMEVAVIIARRERERFEKLKKQKQQRGNRAPASSTRQLKK